MTFEQMRAETELLYESINSAPAPGFTNIEWGQILTVAQRRVVTNILNQGITKNAFNIASIEALVKADVYIDFQMDTHFKNTDGTSAQILDNAVKALDSRYFWIIDEYATTGVKTNIPLKRRSFDFYRINIDNPFRQPNDTDGYWIVQYNNTVVFITDGRDMEAYNVLGCYHPDLYPIGEGITYGTEGSCLNIGVHSKIVEEAVKIARMSVEDAQGYQLAIADFSK